LGITIWVGSSCRSKLAGCCCPPTYPYGRSRTQETIWDNRVAWVVTPRLECILGHSGLAGAASTVARLLAVSQENRRTNCSLKCERSRFRSVAGLGSGVLFCASATGTEMGTGQSNCGLDDFSWGRRAPHRHLARARRNRQNQSQLPRDPSGRVPFNAIWALARFCSKKCCPNIDELRIIRARVSDMPPRAW
jgi:hypothetical protein